MSHLDGEGEAIAEGLTAGVAESWAEKATGAIDPIASAITQLTVFNTRTFMRLSSAIMLLTNGKESMRPGFSARTDSAPNIAKGIWLRAVHHSYFKIKTTIG
jgi:hypothetical protein